MSSGDETPPPFFLKPGDEPKVVATLCEDLRLPDGISRIVRISFQTYEHIVSRRAKEQEWHVELTLHRLASVIVAPSYVGRLGTDAQRIELYRRADGDTCGVCVSLKCLRGETWINTAFPLGARSLQKHLGTSRLAPLERLQGSLFKID